MHVRKGTSVAKYWLEATICLAQSYGMTPHELNALQKVVEKNAEAIIHAWHEHFGQ